MTLFIIAAGQGFPVKWLYINVETFNLLTFKDINIAGTPEELFVLVSKNDLSLKFNFFIYGSYFYAKFCVLLKN